MANNFWQTKTLFEMSHQEWESICDGCAKCCLQQLQDDQTEQLVFTDVACDLLDCSTCQCTDYANRSDRVPSCMTMTRENVLQCVEFAPPSCAYRLLAQGDELPAWHHLNSGCTETVHSSGNSVKGRVRFARDINTDCLEDYVVSWP